MNYVGTKKVKTRETIMKVYIINLISLLFLKPECNICDCVYFCIIFIAEVTGRVFDTHI